MPMIKLKHWGLEILLYNAINIVLIRKEKYEKKPDLIVLASLLCEELKLRNVKCSLFLWSY